MRKDIRRPTSPKALAAPFPLPSKAWPFVPVWRLGLGIPTRDHDLQVHAVASENSIRAAFPSVKVPIGLALGRNADSGPG